MKHVGEEGCFGTSSVFTRAVPADCTRVAAETCFSYKLFRDLKFKMPVLYALRTLLLFHRTHHYYYYYYYNYYYYYYYYSYY